MKRETLVSDLLPPENAESYLFSPIAYLTRCKRGPKPPVIFPPTLIFALRSYLGGETRVVIRPPRVYAQLSPQKDWFILFKIHVPRWENKLIRNALGHGPYGGRRQDNAVNLAI